MRSGRNHVGTGKRVLTILAYWEMRSGRNHRPTACPPVCILAYWEMRSGRNRELLVVAAALF